MIEPQLKYRAFYKGDIEKGEPLLFELREVDYELIFVMVKDPEFSYPISVVFLDPMWIKQRFTGLLDKNGTEIYEGDIVRQEKLGRFKNIQVQWGEFGYDCCESGMGFAFPSFSFDSKDYEIIGNIYENPELLSNSTK